MNVEERAQHIIRDLIALPREAWERSVQGGQVTFYVKGMGLQILYFSQGWIDPTADHPLREEALELYRARLGDCSTALEIWDENEEIACLLRWTSINEIEVIEYNHGTWEVMAFGLPATDPAYQPVVH
ncbi:hypothetical protein [Novosphingobium sp. MMS21-SN21R]|uniref:hypothetical protein n=1 Tax=Novosphingobium sp. MMS21-SN21R TaxID=2969298 RepID=UPI002888E3CD|nr:hypothetical protein [Novosphingobium sp. MMS21-SN21R]MDT0506927.1 hypothetical protein [Novosphingobium sp. MMS21-SN21R]